MQVAKLEHSRSRHRRTLRRILVRQLQSNNSVYEDLRVRSIEGGSARPVGELSMSRPPYLATLN